MQFNITSTSAWEEKGQGFRGTSPEALFDVEPRTDVGRVRVNVTAESGPIKPGDLLTTSPRKGYAMKALEHKPGTILGKALEALEEGEGKIMVLVTLQ